MAVAHLQGTRPLRCLARTRFPRVPKTLLNKRSPRHPLSRPTRAAQHCAAALESCATAATALRAASAPVAFARVTCNTPASKALAKAAGVLALPTLSLYRAGAKLVEFTPSARGSAAQAAERLRVVLATVAAEQRTDVHFNMMAGDVRVVDGPPAAPVPKFDYAAMRAAAAAAAKEAEAKGDAEDEDCDADEDAEDCGVKW